MTFFSHNRSLARTHARTHTSKRARATCIFSCAATSITFLLVLSSLFFIARFDRFPFGPWLRMCYYCGHACAWCHTNMSRISNVGATVCIWIVYRCVFSVFVLIYLWQSRKKEVEKMITTIGSQRPRKSQRILVHSFQPDRQKVRMRERVSERENAWYCYRIRTSNPIRTTLLLSTQHCISPFHVCVPHWFVDVPHYLGHIINSMNEFSIFVCQIFGVYTLICRCIGLDYNRYSFSVRSRFSLPFFGDFRVKTKADINENERSQS